MIPGANPLQYSAAYAQMLGLAGFTQQQQNLAQAQAGPQPMAEEPIQQQQQQQQPQQEPAVIQERGGDAETLRQMVAQLESERDELAAKCSTIESRLQG